MVTGRIIRYAVWTNADVTAPRKYFRGAVCINRSGGRRAHTITKYTKKSGGQSAAEPDTPRFFFVRQVISYCLNDIEGESGYFNCGGNNQELLLHHCPVGINDWSNVSVGNETQYEAVMSRIQGLSTGIVIVTTILLFLRVVLVLYISGAG